jgi:hypothetical protein
MEIIKNYSSVVSSFDNYEENNIHDKIETNFSKTSKSNFIKTIVKNSQSTPNLSQPPPLPQPNLFGPLSVSNMAKPQFEELFESFVQADSVRTILSSFESICTKCLQLNRRQLFEHGVNIEHKSQKSKATFTNTRLIYEIIKAKTNYWKANELWKLFDKKANHKDYAIKTTHFNRDMHVLIVGCGPVGLRLAIECAFLGVKCTIVEKRDE